MRYIGPKRKIVRHLGLDSLPAFTTKRKSNRRRKKKKKKRPKSFLFTNRLKEKQKVRYNFNINNYQLFNYLKQAKKISSLADKNKAKEKKELTEIKKTLSAPKATGQLPRLKKNLNLNRVFLISKSKKNYFLSADINQTKKPSNSTKSFFSEKHIGSTGDELIKLLERRFDSIIFRLSFAPTIIMARQLISHGHFLINNKKVNIPSYHCNVNDEITIRSKSKNLIQNLYSKINEKDEKTRRRRTKKKYKKKKHVKKIPYYLLFDEKNFVATIYNEVSNNDPTIYYYYKQLLKLKILYVIEFFSRQL